jgi:hypothetical protein
MGIRAALVTGTVLSLAAVSAWSLSAAGTIGAPGPLHLSRDLPGDYAALASAPTGNGMALFAVVALIYAACFLVSGLRRFRRERTAVLEPERARQDDGAAEYAAGRR